MTSPSGATESRRDGSPRPASLTRLPGLDVLRSVAVLLVLGRHLPPPPPDWPPFPRIAIETWRRGGWVGVDLFFVLSGFLVSGLLFSDYRRHGRIGFGRFYVRRWWKIYPPFAVLTAATIALNERHGAVFDVRAVFTELFFLQSYRQGLWNHTWSLAVEEHFYLLLPCVLYLALRARRSAKPAFSAVPRIAAGLATVTVLLRVITWLRSPAYSHLGNLYASHLRLDALFLGVALSYYYQADPGGLLTWIKRRRLALIGSGSALLVPAFVLPLELSPTIYTAGLTFFAVGSALLVLGALPTAGLSGRLSRMLAWLGGRSYSIYLWHMPVAIWLVPRLDYHLNLNLGYSSWVMGYLLGAVLVGATMSSLVERPMLALRDRWFPSIARVSPPTSGARGSG